MMAQDYMMKVTDKDLLELESKIRKEYKQATDEVERKMNDYLAGFKRRDAVKKKMVKDGTMSKKDYNEWRLGQIAIGQRWEDTKNSLAKTLRNADVAARQMTWESSYDTYAKNFNFVVFQVESATKLNTSFTLYNADAIKKLVRDNPQILPPPGKKVSEKIRQGKATLWDKKQIQSVMTQNILQGEPTRNLAKRLAKTVGDSDMKAAIRNARTMTTTAQNLGRLESIKRSNELGIETWKEWSAIHDGRTRDSHRDLDGTAIPWDEEFLPGLSEPGDPNAAPEEVYNCRCALKTYMPKYDIPTERTAERYGRWLLEHGEY